MNYVEEEDIDGAKEEKEEKKKKNPLESCSETVGNGYDSGTSLLSVRCSV